MATRADMGRLKSKLQTSGDFRWVIDCSPVVANLYMADSEHFPDHNHDSGFSLNNSLVKYTGMESTSNPATNSFVQTNTVSHLVL